MPDRRGTRFALEVLFLVGLAVALTLADLEPIEIGGIMLLGWVIVAVLEWVAWRERPHYGSGLPPRYYVPQVSLPPAQPLEQVSAGYPEARDEAPTWIASAALRDEVLGEWPVAVRPVAQVVEERELEVDPDPWTHAEELPVAPLAELEPEPVARPEPEPVAQAEPESVAQPEPESVAQAQPEPVAQPEPEPVAQPEPEPVAQPRPVARPEPEPPSVAEPAPSPEVALVASVRVVTVARYSLDPLAEPQPRRRFRRSAGGQLDVVEVPARPGGVRALPGRTDRQDSPG
jgi:hypothetical protein